jgi:hypothetical protein
VINLLVMLDNQVLTVVSQQELETEITLASAQILLSVLFLLVKTQFADLLVKLVLGEMEEISLLIAVLPLYQIVMTTIFAQQTLVIAVG